ncbi:MAG: hypothetical protein MN733_28270 [Nitrososphaera sp.]|nr:hypothetical protein [Nitrososphaera sp.]
MSIKNPLTAPFWVVLPYNQANLQPGTTRGSQMLILQTRSALPDGVVERIKIGVPMFFSKPEAFEEARRMAMASRDIPIVCEMISYMEIPLDVRVVVKSFTPDGEIKAEQ